MPPARATGERKGYYANLPAETPVRRLVALARARWAIEQFYADAQGDRGLDDYPGRRGRWDGLHRHLARVMLAYSFLVVRALAPQATPPDEAFPPSAPVQSARRLSPGIRLAFPGSVVVAGSDEPTAALPPS